MIRRAMIRRRNAAWRPANSWPFLPLACAVVLLAFSFYGCKRNGHTSDSRLRKIDEMLNSQLPQGTPRSRVEYFLNSRGYKLEDSPDKSSFIGVVRHVDTDTLQPATARVTFHFDVNNKLTSYELQSVPDAPLRP
jgi:hypothetical protein